MSTEDVSRGQEQEARVDWNQVRHRLEMAGAALAAGPSAEETRATLKARARALAREPEKTAATQESIEIIAFSLASETYAIETEFVREVHPLKDLTPLPGTPPFVLGIVNVRGQILSVVDLKRFFNLPRKGLGELNKVIVIGNDRMELGILADAILAARLIPLDAIQPSPLAVSGIGAEYLKGVTAECEIILDAGKILGDEKIIVNQESTEKLVSEPYHEEEVI
jgi:purine-binding chemotaxis protein CheW